MRTSLTITLILTITWTVNTFGQAPCKEGWVITQNGDTLIMSYAEKMPYLKAGVEPYMKWIKSNMNRKLITKKEEEKKVFIGFVVHEDGRISDFKIDKGIGDPYDREALRLIMNNPQTWVAGHCGDKKVKTRMTMPVKF